MTKKLEDLLDMAPAKEVKAEQEQSTEVIPIAKPRTHSRRYTKSNR